MERTNEQQFEKMIAGLTRKADFKRWPEYIFFFRKDECLFRYNLIFGYLWCDAKKVWKVLGYERHNYNFREVQSFIKKQVEAHFKLEVVTPSIIAGLQSLSLKKHFKL